MNVILILLSKEFRNKCFSFNMFLNFLLEIYSIVLLVGFILTFDVFVGQNYRELLFLILIILPMIIALPLVIGGNIYKIVDSDYQYIVLSPLPYNYIAYYGMYRKLTPLLKVVRLLVIPIFVFLNFVLELGIFNSIVLVLMMILLFIQYFITFFLVYRKGLKKIFKTLDVFSIFSSIIMIFLFINMDMSWIALAFLLLNLLLVYKLIKVFNYEINRPMIKNEKNMKSKTKSDTDKFSSVKNFKNGNLFYKQLMEMKNQNKRFIDWKLILISVVSVGIAIGWIQTTTESGSRIDDAYIILLSILMTNFSCAYFVNPQLSEDLKSHLIRLLPINIYKKFFYLNLYTYLKSMVVASIVFIFLMINLNFSFLLYVIISLFFLSFLILNPIQILVMNTFFPTFNLKETAGLNIQMILNVMINLPALIIYLMLYLLGGMMLGLVLGIVINIFVYFFMIKICRISIM